MFTFNLNGNPTTAEKDMSLLTYLRDEAGILSVKNGCAEGACGTCMVLIDGKATKACIVKLSKLENKSVITIEGMTQYEQAVYAHVFAEAGAVQCGFCIPGMVISAKGLLDKNLTPTRAEVKAAIKGNICRCTGYKKIEDAILMAADFLRENRTVPAIPEQCKIGDNFPRVDAALKTLGQAKYADDYRFPGMLYGSALRTKYPRAKILSINTEKAKAHPGVVGVYTAEDIPGKRAIGHLVKDWDAMIAVGEITRYVGDSVALVAAESKEALETALGLIEVEYEELTPITSPQEALKEGAPLIHANGNLLKKEHLSHGDVETALKNSKHVVTYHYSTPFTDHAFLEPECATAMPDGDGILLYTASQSVYDERREISELLDIPAEKLRVISAYVGGGFGGKEDMSVQHHAAFLAYMTKRPVKVIFSRKESLWVHTKRHAAEMEFTTGCDENGYITAMKAVIITDTGAYASLGGPVLQRACTHAAGPYNFQNIDITGMAVYTNNPPGGAFRGFGVTQSAFAAESNLNKLAELVGISPWEIRYRNAIRPGQVLPNGQIADEGTALVETLEAVKEEYHKHPYAGIACAMKNAGIGVGIPDIGRCKVAVVDGKIHVRTSAACIGQGLATVLLQVVCETLNVEASKVVIDAPDTQMTPNSGTTTASRQTVFTGEATRQAALQLKEQLDAGKSLADLDGQEFYGEYASVTDPMGSDKPNPVSHVSYGYATQVVILDDEGRLKKVVAAHDVGRAINPNSVEGQIEGGVVMGLGYGLTEDYPLQNSIPQGKYGTIGLFRADAVPEIESIVIEKNHDTLAFGAKGVGEITTIPTAPACQSAYYALDKVFRTSLPLDNTFYRKPKK